MVLGFPTELTRKHVADAFLKAELEIEARQVTTNRLATWRFKRDDDRKQFIEEVVEIAQSSLYAHHQNENCHRKGACDSYNVLLITYLPIYSMISRYL